MGAASGISGCGAHLPGKNKNIREILELPEGNNKNTGLLAKAGVSLRKPAMHITKPRCCKKAVTGLYQTLRKKTVYLVSRDWL
jgi:hypothetical protein